MVTPSLMLLEPGQLVWPPLRTAKGWLAWTRALMAVATSSVERGVMMQAGLSFALADQ